MNDEPVPFYLERLVWPYVHTLIAGALYIALRNPAWTLLFVYIFESLELAFSFAFVMVSMILAEAPADSLIGDILMALLIILILFTLDRATGADVAFILVVSPVERLWAFALAGAISPLAALFGTEHFNFGVLLFYTLYVIIALAFYHRIIFGVEPGSVEWVAGRSIITWLLLSGAYTLVALPAFADGFLASMFMRMLIVSLFSLLTAAVVFHFSVWARVLAISARARE